jgi:hypothetical protein
LVISNNQYTCLIITRSVLFKTVNVLDKSNTHILYSKPPFLFENRAVYKVMLKNVEPGRPHMRIACWMTKATGTNSEYVVRIAVPL